jgi:glycosyltransferase involved in cell wall biosynthesis
MSWLSKTPRARVGIVTCTKGRPLLLARAIANILGQTWAEWHLYIVNDGGDRAELERVLEPFAPHFEGRVTVIHREVCGGIGAASNTGLKLCQEDYIAIHEDDDTWEPSFLATCVARLDAAGDPYGACVVRCNLIREEIRSGDIIELSREIYNDWQKSFISFFRIAETLTYPPICLVVRKSVLDRVGLFREDLPVLMDWDFALKMFRDRDVLFVSEVLANYHRRETARGADANTLFGIPESYGVSDMKIRNDWLRKDLQEDKVSMGLLLAMGHSHGQLFGEISSLKAQLARIEKLLESKS